MPALRPFCTSNFTIGFFVPPSEDDPPAPTSPVVSMKEIGSRTFYVSQVRLARSLSDRSNLKTTTVDCAHMASPPLLDHSAAMPQLL